MTKAEKLINASQCSIPLCFKHEGRNDKEMEVYVAEFKPGLPNPLLIAEKGYDDDDSHGNKIQLSYKSAIEFAKFLKALFLDEDTED